MKPRVLFQILLMFACIQPAFTFQKDLLKNKGNIIGAQFLPEKITSSNKIFDVVLTTDRKDTIYGRVRMPISNRNNYPLVFLIVGIETGRDVVEMISGYDSVIVFGMDYPHKGPLDFTGWKSLTTAFELREAGFRSVRNISLCLDWLSSLPEVDTTDITIVAVSFGIFTAMPAAVLDRRVDRFVAVQAGGDLYTILSMNAERLGFPLPTWLAAWLGSIILSPFEPNDYIEYLSPRPLLIVSSESDLLFPKVSVQSLYDHAKEPKEWIKNQSRHVDPSEGELILELTEIVGKKLFSE